MNIYRSGADDNDSSEEIDEYWAQDGKKKINKIKQRREWRRAELEDIGTKERKTDYPISNFFVTSLQPLLLFTNKLHLNQKFTIFLEICAKKYNSGNFLKLDCTKNITISL